MRNIGILILLSAAVMLAVPQGTQAAEKTQIIATDIGDPFNILKTGPIGYFDTSSTTIICPGHEPTNNPLQPCPPGSRTNYRGLVIGAIPLTSEDLRFNGGLQTVEINVNYDANGEGPFWGKERVDLLDGGVLEGSLNGQYYNGGAIGLGKAELHGMGGSVDGLIIKVDAQAYHIFGGAVFTDTYTFTIIDPHAKK